MPPVYAPSSQSRDGFESDFSHLRGDVAPDHDKFVRTRLQSLCLYAYLRPLSNQRAGRPNGGGRHGTSSIIPESLTHLSRCTDRGNHTLRPRNHGHHGGCRLTRYYHPFAHFLQHANLLVSLTRRCRNRHHDRLHRPISCRACGRTQ